MSVQYRRPLVVGIDDTASGQLAVRWAVEEAQRRGCPIRVVSAYEVTPDAMPPYPATRSVPGELRQNRFDDAVAHAAGRPCRDRVGGRLVPPDPGLVADERAEREHWLAEKAGAISEKHPGVPATTQVVDRSAGQELAERSDAATLVVVGSRGHGAVPGLLLGSVSQYLLRHARCTVLVAREPGR